jgi:predicted DNA binding CopG/RHH family protein
LRLCWLLLLEEYAVSFEYLPGKKNLVAYTLKRTQEDVLSKMKAVSVKIESNDLTVVRNEGSKSTFNGLT